MNTSCGVVVFNWTEWLIQYPEFGAVSQAAAQSYFNRVTAGGLIDNTPQSPIQDLFQRTIILNLATCHVAALAGALNPSQAQVVGRVSSATQGSVSVSFDMPVKGGELAVYWNQTQYGAQVYAMTLPFRTAIYVPPVRRPRFGPFGRGF